MMHGSGMGEGQGPEGKGGGGGASGGRNLEFYKDCADYFECLRKRGATDYGFEDEYYFTMPAISSD